MGKAEGRALVSKQVFKVEIEDFVLSRTEDMTVGVDDSFLFAEEMKDLAQQVAEFAWDKLRGDVK